MQAPLVFSGFPAGYCWQSDPNVTFQNFVSLTHAEVPENITGVAHGPTAPMGDTVKLFYSTVFDRLYSFHSLGIWVSRYWCENDPRIKMITEKDVAAVAAWDNPNGAVVVGAEAHTGPFWEIDHNYDARIILGPGTLPVQALVVPVGGFGGVDAAIQTEGEVGKHRHKITIGPEANTDSYLPAEAHEAGGLRVKGGTEALTFEITGNTVVGQTRQNGGAAVVTPMSRMPPYRAAYVVKRTARIWHTL